jgi:hypothetical protein
MLTQAFHIAIAAVLGAEAVWAQMASDPETQVWRGVLGFSSCVLVYLTMFERK